jgi:hypothetical protein
MTNQRHACGIAARIIQVEHETGCDRIETNHKYNGDSRGCSLCCHCCRRCLCKDQRDRAHDQLSRQAWEAVVLPLSIAVYNGDVAALDEPGVTQATPKSIY